MFRRDGIVASGVVGLMKGVGLTQGGFYAHFDSKESPIREAAVAAIVETCEGLERIADAAGSGVPGLEAVTKVYLSTNHLIRVENGCAIAAIGAELGREPTHTRQAVAETTQRIVSLIEENLPESAQARHDVSGAVFSLMSGSLQLARLTPDAAEAERTLAAGRSAAFVLSGIGH
jgi:TetR/AcrR family transcriptional repressor of nem operon